MKKKLIAFLKYCRPLYLTYYYLGTACLNLMKVFIKTDDHLILFGSFGGKAFSDSPKAIYLEMLKDPRFKDYKAVWAFNDPSAHKLKHADAIKTDTLGYFLTAMKARCWVTNSSLERGLGLRGKHTYFVNTWHGTPLKKMGSDATESGTVFDSKNTYNMDLFTTQCAYESEIFTRVFRLKEGVCQVIGLPRNDELAHADAEDKARCRKKLGLKEQQKVILYAPTFRDYVTNTSLQRVFDAPVDFKAWKETLGEDGVILVRAHYETVSSMKGEMDGVMDVTDWPSINELMIASDALVSDYSSVFFDYSILGRPMICFAYDYDRYEKERGMYFDIREKLDWAGEEKELFTLTGQLRDSDFQAQAEEKARAFAKEFVESSGSASSRVLDIMYQNL